MAAPMCLFWNITTKINIQRLYIVRHYARNVRRSVRGVISPEDDAVNSKIRSDPRQNPFVPYIPDDPVQETLLMKTANRKSTGKLTQPSRAKIHDNSIDPETIEFNYNRNNSRGKNFGISDDAIKEFQTETSKEVRHRHKDKHRKKDNVRVTKNGIEYEFLNNDDKRFGRLILQAKSRKGRSDQGEVVLEGKNLILDSIHAGVNLKNLYFTNPDVMDYLPLDQLEDVNLYRVLYKHLQILSDVETSQGILGLFEMPDLRVQSCSSAHLPVTLICDNVRDGGNLGTLIRTAAAVGCQRVVILKGCVDIWNTKVLRSAMGAHFRVPVFSNISWPQVPALLTRHHSLRVFLADVKQPTADHVSRLSGTEDSLLKIESLSLESYNQGRQSSDTNAEPDDTGYESDVESSDLEVDKDYSKKRVLDAFREAPLNVQLYDKAVYGERGISDSHSVLVVSGETSGLAPEARKLAYDNYGECVCVPMAGDVESLNCAVAGSVILYEMHRQLRSED